MTPEIVDSLWHLVGMERVELLGGRLYKDDPRMTLNFSAIAKGYAVDVVASFLRGKGVENYLVEIGGEVVARGKNERGEIWRVGIDTPDEGNVAGGEIDAVVMLDDAALATSGNYRNFRIVDGRRVAHTINPATGYPVQHSLLSATVLASDCMTADAYATAFMVLGVEKSMEIASRHPDMEVCGRFGRRIGRYDARYEAIYLRRMTKCFRFYKEGIFLLFSSLKWYKILYRTNILYIFAVRNNSKT